MLNEEFHTKGAHQLPLVALVILLNQQSFHLDTLRFVDIRLVIQTRLAFTFFPNVRRYTSCQ